MQNIVYKKIPLQKHEGYCPICDAYIRSKEKITFIAHHMNGQLKTFSYGISYCEKCGIPSDIGQLNRILNIRCACSVDLLGVWKNSDPKSLAKEIIINQEQNQSEQYSSYYQLISNDSPFREHYYFIEPSETINDDQLTFKEIVAWYYERMLPSESIREYQEDLNIKLLTEENGEKCQQCGNALTKRRVYLSVNSRFYLQIDGMFCENCSLMYIKDLSHIKDLLKGNGNRAGRKIQIDKKQYYCYINKARHDYFDSLESRKLDAEKAAERRKIEIKQNELKKIESAIAKITISFSDSEPIDYIIVSKKNRINQIHNILYYEDDLAMELLSAAYVKERNLKGFINGKRYSVTDKLFADNYHTYQIILKQINIKADGGFPSSVKNNSQQIINVLMYSPFTNRLEKIRATYDRSEERCYIDMFLFRKFVEKFGNPGVSYNFISKNKSYTQFSNLNAESILKSIGYTVSNKDNLSAEYRRNLLCDLVDLKILSVHEIISYLRFFINSHSADMYYSAREKWESDLRFIETYKANPERFLIAH